MVASAKGAIAAIGNFDGVHRGHQHLLEKTAELAAVATGEAAAIVFDPHPRRYFRPNDPPFLITTPARRNALLREAGAERVISLRFDAALAALGPEDFVVRILKRRLGLAGVVTGREFRFGTGRAGDADALKRLCAKEGLQAVAIEPVIGAGEGKIGSSAIRAALAAGEMRVAATMLGRPWVVSGGVMPGQQLGRTLGFPTANLTLGELVEPRRGVYAVRVKVEGADFTGVANFGRRPTVGSPAPLLETHLFDFSEDLYGREIDVAFIDFIREERKFDSLDALASQIGLDCEEARRRLSQ